jgi:GGDEF domain-containing protein
MSQFGALPMAFKGLIPGSKDTQPGLEKPPVQNLERSLTLLIEGAALNVPEIDSAAYKIFRSQVSKLSMKMPDRLAENEKLELIKSIVNEFETYRNSSETALRERLNEWRGATKTLLSELVTSLSLDPKDPAVNPLMTEIGQLTTAEEIASWGSRLQDFLHPPDAEGRAMGLAALKNANCSLENDNAAGLRGGGAAVVYLKKLMERGGSGFIAVFQLSCLDIIEKRFGPEAVQDCLMAVSSFLTDSLHNDDVIFHWSDTSLLAILQGRANEQILGAELGRIIHHNRESSIMVDGRPIMLRIPLSFELTPISRLRAAEDIFRLSAPQKTQW